MSARVLFLGGNGHAGARLAPARRALASRGDPFEIVDVPYAGFEGRARAPDYGAFLDLIAAAAARARADVMHAAGIGGLFALSLRARGALRDVPVILQGPVLWGLERRLMPRVLRFPPARAALRSLFGLGVFRRHFAGRYFQRRPPDDVLAAFFAGYDACAAFEDLFAWCTPELLRELEAAFAAAPRALEGVTAWWGDHDRVVSLDELRVTERALGVTIPVRRFPDWGHYPMIDDPEGWVEALHDALA
jgi:pimeloyl-ACP methyl ester carboxylesterase